MKRNVFTMMFFLAFSMAGRTQGWVGNNGVLFPVDQSLQLSPLNVGIGLSNPAAQFHTNGSVIFEGLTYNEEVKRVIVQGDDGMLYYRDISSLIPSQQPAWLLSGNAGTNANNYLGTSDATRLSIRTNATERVSILANGRVGINNANPVAQMEISGSTDNHLRISGLAPSTHYIASTNTATTVFAGRIGLATSAMQLVPTSNTGDFVIQNIGYDANGVRGDLILGAGRNTTTGNNNGFEIMRMRQVTPVKGRVGIGTTNPTAQLHTTDSVRHENLPSGSGTPLVIDANGYIWQQSQSGGIQAVSNSEEIQMELASLKSQVAELTAQLREIQGLVKKGDLVRNTRNSYLISPNPSTRNIRVESTSRLAAKKHVTVTDESGRQVVRPTNFKDVLNLSLDTAPSGTYIVSVFENDQLVSSEKVIIRK